MHDISVPCCEWRGAYTLSGRGFTSKGPKGAQKRTYVYRTAYVEAYGPIPAGMVIDHVCGNPRCYEPLHLEAVTPAENTRRYWAKRTHCANGHPWNDENTWLSKNGHRQCRACNRERQQRYARG